MKKTKTQKTRRPPLSIHERSTIEIRWCTDHKSISEIARELGRNKSSISRDIGGRPRIGRGRYRALYTHTLASARIACRGNTPKTMKQDMLRTYIEEKLRLGWSPEQISIRLPIDFPDNETMRISYEAIYQEVYRRVHRGGNGEVKQGETDLRPYLTRRHKRRAKKGFRKAQKAERDASLPSIEARPSIVDTRTRIGDWEDDSLMSRESVARLKNITERVSGVTLLGKTTDGTAEHCDRVVVEKLIRLPADVRKTLTRDRGSENVHWRELEQALGLNTFFAHPYCSHERGTNENTNGLIRRFFPKRTNWSEVSDEELLHVEYLLNTRPRKRHGGLTPVEVFFNRTGVAIYS